MVKVGSGRIGGSNQEIFGEDVFSGFGGAVCIVLSGRVECPCGAGGNLNSLAGGVVGVEFITVNIRLFLKSLCRIRF